MCQCRSISHEKCTTLVGNVDRGGGYAFAGQGVYGKSLYRQLYFAVNLTLLWKIKSILRKYLIWLPQRICPLGFLLYLWCVQLNTDKWRCSMEKKSQGLTSFMCYGYKRVMDDHRHLAHVWPWTQGSLFGEWVQLHLDKCFMKGRIKHDAWNA